MHGCQAKTCRQVRTELVNSGLSRFRALRRRRLRPRRLFLWIYVLITPWREFALIRAGNSAAANGADRRAAGLQPAARRHHRAFGEADRRRAVGVGRPRLCRSIVHVGDACHAARAQAGDRSRSSGRRHHRRRLAVSFGLINAACLTTDVVVECMPPPARRARSACQAGSSSR